MRLHSGSIPNAKTRTSSEALIVQTQLEVFQTHPPMNLSTQDYGVTVAFSPWQLFHLHVSPSPSKFNPHSSLLIHIYSTVHLN